MSDEGKHEGIRGHEEHEDKKNHEGIRMHEGHEDESSVCADESRSRLRTFSPLSSREERAISRVIGCALAVHRELGPGFLESIYKKALAIELALQGVAYEAERSIRVLYRGTEIPGQRVDLIVDELVVVELKTVDRFDSVHVAQVISYLKTLNMRAGLLINFRSSLLRLGLKRVVL